jgi:hypothetical protein
MVPQQPYPPPAMGPPPNSQLALSMLPFRTLAFVFIICAGLGSVLAWLVKVCQGFFFHEIVRARFFKLKFAGLKSVLGLVKVSVVFFSRY